MEERRDPAEENNMPSMLILAVDQRPERRPGAAVPGWRTGGVFQWAWPMTVAGLSF